MRISERSIAIIFYNLNGHSAILLACSLEESLNLLPTALRRQKVNDGSNNDLISRSDSRRIDSVGDWMRSEVADQVVQHLFLEHRELPLDPRTVLDG